MKTIEYKIAFILGNYSYMRIVYILIEIIIIDSA